MLLHSVSVPLGGAFPLLWENCHQGSGALCPRTSGQQAMAEMGLRPVGVPRHAGSGQGLHSEKLLRPSGNVRSLLLGASTLCWSVPGRAASFHQKRTDSQ